jgi:putative membrane protein
MSEKLLRGCLLSAALIASQSLASAALAQQTEEYRPRQSTTDRGTATDTTRKTNAMSKTVSPQSFASQAAVISQAEIELGQLAAKKSQDDDVREFAQRMVKDHKASAAKLEKVAKQNNLMLPKSLDAEHQAVKEKLSALQGDAFDSEYAKEMAKGHDKAVALFEAASQAPQMPAELKEFAAATLPTLKEHDKLAHSLNADQKD